MLEPEETRKAIAYITGGIILDLHPPNSFKLQPSVKVDGLEVNVKATDGADPTIWKYLAVMEKGDHSVEVSLGNVRVSHANARVGQTNTLNFHFGSSE